MTLQILWAGPWGEGQPLAAFGAKIVDELLARGNRVRVLRTETGWAARRRPYATSAEVQLWKRAPVRDLVRQSDALIVNLCEDANTCGAPLDTFYDLGALGIVHDGSLQRLADAWARRSRNRKAVTQAMGDGDAWFASGLAGALVHRRENLASIEAACPGPVRLAAAAQGGEPTISAYVDRLLDLVQEVIARRPAILAGLALGTALAELGAPTSADVDAIAACVGELIGPA